MHIYTYIIIDIVSWSAGLEAGLGHDLEDSAEGPREDGDGKFFGDRSHRSKTKAKTKGKKKTVDAVTV